MPVSVLVDNEFRIPMGIRNLADFREWARSPEFPEHGRIDYIDNRIEVDRLTEDPFLHGTPKAEIARVVANRVKLLDLGDVFIDATRISCPSVALSAEPDLVVVSHEAFVSGRVRWVVGASGVSGRSRELDVAPDLVVEVVSDSSVEKDTVRLFRDYHVAGVTEYWLVDARAEDALRFVIWQWQTDGYEQTKPNGDGYQTSNVLSTAYLFKRSRRPDGRWVYDLIEANR